MNKILQSGFDLSGFFEGRVVENVDPDNEGKIGVVIPRLIPFKGSAIEKDDTEESIIANNNDESVTNLGSPSRTLKCSNWIWAERAANRYHTDQGASGNFIIPPIGAKVFVIFVNQDIRRPYYLPFGPAVDGSSKLVSEQQLTEKTDVIHETLEGDVIEFDNEKKVLYIKMKDGCGVVLDREKNTVTVHSKENAAQIVLEEKNINVKANLITINADQKITLKTKKSSMWQPNIVKICPFSGLPHGGIGGGLDDIAGS